METQYQSETYRRRGLEKGSKEYERWMSEVVGYWRFVEGEDVLLAEAAQRGFGNGVLARGRVHPVEGLFVLLSSRLVFFPPLT